MSPSLRRRRPAGATPGQVAAGSAQGTVTAQRLKGSAELVPGDPGRSTHLTGRGSGIRKWREGGPEESPTRLQTAAGAQRSPGSIAGSQGKG